MGSSALLNAEAPEFYPSNNTLLQPPQNNYTFYPYYPLHLLYPPSTATNHHHPFYFLTNKLSTFYFGFHPNHQLTTFHSKPTLHFNNLEDKRQQELLKNEVVVVESSREMENRHASRFVWRRKGETKHVHVGDQTNNHHHHHRHNSRQEQHYSVRVFPLRHHRRHYHNNHIGGGGGGNFPVMHVRPDGDQTTVMIKNIPNKYTRVMLVDFLENHCRIENDKDNEKEEEATSAFDFVYLPIDFKSGLNKGYAFVNFTKAKAAWKFVETASNKKWELFLSNKIRHVVAARLQGKEKLEKHFEAMNFACESEEVLPVSFSPPRDGVVKGNQKTMGNLVFK